MQEGTSSVKMIKNSVMYTVVGIMRRGISFLLLPLYTYYLTPADYGIYNMVNMLTLLLSTICSFALNNAITRFYSQYRSNTKEFRIFSSTVTVFVTISTAIICVALYFCGGPIFSSTMSGIALYPYILLGLLAAFATALYNLYLFQLNARQEGLKFTLNSIAYFLSYVALNIFFVVVLKLGASGVLLATALDAVIFGFLAIVSMAQKRYIGFHFSFRYLKQALVYSVPLLPHILSGQITAFISRSLLNVNNSLQAVGLYNTGYSFASVIETAQLSINDAYRPWFFNVMNDGGIQKGKIPKMTAVLAKCSNVIAVFIALFIKETLRVMTQSDYRGAWIVVPVFVIAYLFRSAYMFLVTPCMYNMRASKLIFVITISSDLMAVITTAMLVDRMGILGPAIGYLISRIFSCIAMGILSLWMEPVGLPVWSFTFNIIFSIAVIGIGLFFDIRDQSVVIVWGRVGYKAVVFLVYFLITIGKDIPYLIRSVKEVLPSRKR